MTTIRVQMASEACTRIKCSVLVPNQLQYTIQTNSNKVSRRMEAMYKQRGIGQKNQKAQ
ncbi:Hypothetical predicted protein, partial [Pelobates cultripes]